MNSVKHNQNIKEMLKPYLEEYLIRKGINTKTNFKCLNPLHEDNKPSMGLDRSNYRVKCFSCPTSYDIIDLIQLDYGITSYTEALKKGCELFGLSYSSTPTTPSAPNPKSQYTTKTTSSTDINLSTYYEKCHALAKNTNYFAERGLGESVIERFKLGFDSSFNGLGGKWQAVIIPTGESSYVARNTDKTSDARYKKFGQVQFLNFEDALKKNEPVFIVEGEIDALSVIEGGYNAIALGSLSNTHQFSKKLETFTPQFSNKIIVCLDNDARGNEKAQEFIQELKDLGYKAVKGDISGQYKDANEILIKDREAFKALLQKAITQSETEIDIEAQEHLEKRKADYEKKRTRNYIKDFMDGIRERANTPYIPTGFTQLDSILDGGLFEGLYIIGAISSLGKTTFTLQMADQIAKSGQDVLIISLEMARAELMAKSISRETLLNGNSIANAKTTRGITTYSRYLKYSKEELDLINTSIKSYSDYAQNIVIEEGQGNISALDVKGFVQEHIELTGRKPVVFIDYLQILAPCTDKRSDIRENIDRNITILKQISRDFKIPVFAISSINRKNYSVKISMEAFKESGAIEYSSDILMGLQFSNAGSSNFDPDVAKSESNNPNKPRELELVILKNRNGRTGDSIPFSYYPLFNYFKEGV
jgi:replicative DNA helicase